MAASRSQRASRADRRRAIARTRAERCAGDAVEGMACRGDGDECRMGIGLGTDAPDPGRADGNHGLGTEHAGHSLHELRREIASQPCGFEVQMDLQEQTQLVRRERARHPWPWHRDDAGQIRNRGFWVHSLDQFHLDGRLTSPQRQLSAATHS